MKSHKLSAPLLLIILLSSCVYSQTGWVLVNPGFGHSYNSVYFIDSQTGLACGQSGAMIRTTNGGANWTNINAGVTVALNDVKFLSPTIAVAAGDYEIIIRSTNAGLNWTVVFPQSTTDYGIRLINNFDQGSAICNSFIYINPTEYTYLYKTTNYGANWQKVQTYVTNRWLHFININTGWAYGSIHYGPPLNQYFLQVNKTINGGSNWTLLYQSDGTSINPNIIYFYDANVGYKQSSMVSTYFSKSVDGGSSWGSGGVALSHIIRSFCFINQSTGWIAGDNSLLYTTSNNGANWTSQTTPVNTNFKSIYFINSLTGWIAVGTSGILLTKMGGIYTAVKRISDYMPGSFSLSQNYPNPFNPSTTIKFDIPKFSHVQIVVYDLLGKEVEQLINEERKPGSYEVNWDGSRFASGVYFYKVIIRQTGPAADEFVETKKMILMK